MVSDDVRIERVKLKDLPAMAARFIDGAKPGTFIPITKHRAEAMVHNPNADAEDVAMLLATVGERCVGYFGVMAVMLQHEGKLHKVHWLTTWAVAPDFIGTGLGSRLMEEALALDVDLAIVGSKPARRLSAKYGFHEVKPLDYVQIDFGIAGRYNPISLLLRLLRKLFSFISVSVPMERLAKNAEEIFESVFGPLIRPFLMYVAIRSLDARFKDLKGSAPKQLESGIFTGIDSKKTQFYRTAQVVNWTLSYPWVLPSNKSETAGLNYAFTDWRYGFDLFCMKFISSEDKDVGFIVLQLSYLKNRPLFKVLDYKQIKDIHLFGAVLLFSRKHKLSFGVIEGPRELAEVLPAWMRPLVLIRKQRTLQVHPRAADSPLGRAWQQVEQTYVDGDTAFT